ncbi:ABC transporter permease [Methanospirillum stamsii]|uniref:Molybdenum ABC transporter permease n=1 Tax=Methanospirillum stamsii TaxID=1277351 RepID=A0A2V2NAU2_9EURY|nr:ABC transporter permease [Methanospirillum stamsii]PWR73598.1 molybdenum ABC transporter permease [Methanospirillum stamsii]
MNRPDLFTSVCIFAGSLPVLLIILGLLVLTGLQVADPETFIDAILDPSVIDSILLTFTAAACSTLILFAIGTPLAYLLSRQKFPLKSVVEGLIDLPLVIPHTVAGIIVYLLCMRQGLLGLPGSLVGIRFEETIAGIIIAMLFVSVPYYVNTVREGFSRVPVRLEQVARSLGATPGRAFVQISLPLTTRHILTGGLMAWGRGVSEFAAVVMIAYHPMIISTLIYQRFNTGGLYAATAVAFVMVVFSLLLFVFIRILGGRLLSEVR